MTAKFSIFSFLVTVFLSCSENEQTAEPVQTYNKLVIDTATTVKASADSAILKSILQPRVGARSLTGLPENTSQNNGNVLPVGGNSRLNPAHGQPGHRCEIAVGAPLDNKPLPISNPTQIQPPTNVTQAQPVTITPPVAKAVAAGMNPAHGQPNHRCDIAVGAPLNSKPAPKSTAPAIANTQPATAVGTPATIQKVAPGMNPAHGQPNHRCDIAVGAPLNSKPTIPATNPVIAEPAKVDSVKN